MIGEKEKEAVLRVLDSGVIAQGPAVQEFEKAFARMVGVREAVAVSSGTAALMVALAANGIGKGDEVITTPFSFIASSNSVLFVGARPRFVDVCKDDFNINPCLIEDAVTSRTKAILIVHLYGHPCRMKEICAVANAHGLLVIEDACQAHGAMIGDRQVGSFGTACFSFYPTKNITTGEGGMITTDNLRVAEKARRLRAHGQSQRYRHDLLGYNWRMTDISAAIGLVQLDTLAHGNVRRRQNARFLDRRLEGVVTPSERQGCHHVYHQYTVRVGDRRDSLLQHLRENGVGAEVYYPRPIHRQPLYKQLGYDQPLPVAERLSEEVVSLPVHPSLDEEELDTIVAQTNRFFERS